MARLSPAMRVIVHPTGNGWSWTQVSRNGNPAATAPKTYTSKGNAKRAGYRQMMSLAVSAVLEVVDKDPGYA